MSKGLTKSIFILNYTELFGWGFMITGAVALISHIEDKQGFQFLPQGIFQPILLGGIILIMASRFLKWIFRL